MAKKIVEKKWYQSKTLWTNALLIAIGIAQFVSGELAAGSVITVAGILNAVLRTISDKKIKF